MPIDLPAIMEQRDDGRFRVWIPHGNDLEGSALLCDRFEHGMNVGCLVLTDARNFFLA